MTRSAVGLALGLLLVPSLVHAQPSGDAVLEDGAVTRPFKSVFNSRPAPLAQMNQKFPSAPQKPDAPPSCRMLILPVDPAVDARIVLGTVDERLDPRFVARVPACDSSNMKPPPRD